MSELYTDIIEQIKIRFCRKITKVYCSALGRKTASYRDHFIKRLLKVVTNVYMDIYVYIYMYIMDIYMKISSFPKNRLLLEDVH